MKESFWNFSNKKIIKNFIIIILKTGSGLKMKMRKLIKWTKKRNIEWGEWSMQTPFWEIRTWWMSKERFIRRELWKTNIVTILNLPNYKLNCKYLKRKTQGSWEKHWLHLIIKLRKMGNSQTLKKLKISSSLNN